MQTNETLGAKEAVSEPVELNGQKEVPGVIEVVISEVDRQEADKFSSITDCLLCTALKNRGFNIEWVGPESAIIEGEYYRVIPMAGVEETRAKMDELANLIRPAPFFEPEVVGKKFTFTRRNP